MATAAASSTHSVVRRRLNPHPFAASVGAALLVVGVRVMLWVGVQLLVAAVIVFGGFHGSREAFNAAAGWWMAYAALIDLGTLAVVWWLMHRHRISYRDLLGPPAAGWQVALGALAVVAATAPAVFFSAELTTGVYGDASSPLLSVVDVPPLAAAFSALVVPLLTELGEPVAYLGVVLPRLERAIGRSWIAAPIVVAIWAVEHAFFPILIRDGGIDLAFAAYRVASVLPFLAIWTAAYYAFGRRLLPIMAARWVFNGGMAFALALGLVA